MRKTRVVSGKTRQPHLRDHLVNYEQLKSGGKKHFDLFSLAELNTRKLFCG
jgi:hypothetical protein